MNPVRQSLPVLMALPESMMVLPSSELANKAQASVELGPNWTAVAKELRLLPKGGG